MKFNDALTSLQRRGKAAEANRLKVRVVSHFEGVLTEEQVLSSEVADLAGVIELFNQLYTEQPQQLNPLEAHIEELQSRGHFIVYGAGYRGKR